MGFHALCIHSGGLLLIALSALNTLHSALAGDCLLLPSGESLA